MSAEDAIIYGHRRLKREKKKTKLPVPPADGLYVKNDKVFHVPPNFHGHR